MAEGHVAGFAPARHFGLHRGAVETMEGVAFDRRGDDALAPENLIESELDRAGSGAR